MNNPDDTATIEPPAEQGLPPILQTIANLKRAVTSRALGLLAVEPSNVAAMSDHRSVYRDLDEMDMEYRANYGLTSRSELPRWVRNTGR